MRLILRRNPFSLVPEFRHEGYPLAPDRSGSETKMGNLLFLFLFALALRLGLVFFVPGYHFAGGMDSYEIMGKNILEGKWMVFSGYGPTAYRAPLYPMFIALVYRIFGQHYEAIWAIQCVLGAATAVLLAVLAKGFVAEKFALAAGVIAAVYLPFIRYHGLVLSETLFILLFVSALCVAAPDWRLASPRRVLLAGGLFGLAALARPVSFLFPFGMIALGVVFSKNIAADIKKATTLMLAFLLVLAPWGIRNWKAFGTPILTTSQGWQSVYAGLHPTARGFGFTGEDFAKPLKEAGVPDTNELETAKVFRARSLQEIRKNPAHFARLAILKFGWFFYPFDGDFYGLGTRYNFLSAMVITLAFFGLALGLRRRANWLLTYAVLYFVFLAVMIYGIPRYRLPLDAVLILWSVIALDALFQRQGRAKTLWVIALAGAVLLNVAMSLDAEGMMKRIKSGLETSMGYSAYFKG